MKYVEQIRIKPGMTVGQLTNEMSNCGVLGAGSLAKATNIIVDMFRDPDYTVFLTMSGPMIPGGLRRIIGEFIDRKLVNVIVSSGANIVHDIIEAIGFNHMREIFFSDFKLRKQGIGRIGDIYVAEKAFQALEHKMFQFFDDLLQKKRRRISICDLLHELGKYLKNKDSMLVKASRHIVPVFSPGLLDSMVGIHIWTYSQLKELQIDPVQDLHKLSDVMYNAKKIGAIILGGGIPKHHVLGASILREGVDSAVQITFDRPECGSLSGAPLEEAISWKKAKSNGEFATVVGDATIVFPLVAAATLELLEKDSLIRDN